MNPEIFWRNIKGILRWAHNSMKWVPFSADSVNKMPLFPIIPTGCPHILAKPVTSVCVNAKWNRFELHNAQYRMQRIIKHKRNPYCSVQFFEFIKFTSIDYTSYYWANIKRLLRISWCNWTKFLYIIQWFLVITSRIVYTCFFSCQMEVLQNVPSQRKTMVFIYCNLQCRRCLRCRNNIQLICLEKNDT